MARENGTARLSKAFGCKDLMNDWEIGGTQNAWVCPSDRHLQLRAQLKSGWSVRTATARSPTTTKAAAMNGISDAEQEQIRKVLARAEAGKQQEKERIGKMVDRLEKMKTRASGNGVTQCLICQTEFGLLASKSYAAMCSDCRKYVCQKNCGVETFDQKRGEPIFLCKLCSEYREVMWKKSGAWFYKEVPTYVKPCDSPASSSAYPPVNGYRHMPNVPSTASPSSGWPSGFSPSPRLSHGNVVSPPVVEQNGGIPGAHGAPRQRQLPIPPDQQQRLKTTPRPRITPSWVHEKVQSSMSIGSEDEESSSSSIDAIDFKTPISNQVPSQQPQPLPPSRRHHYRPREYRHNQSPSQQPTTTSSSCASSSTAPRNLQRFTVSNRNPITDTEESENDESRRTTPSTSPRHSLATPSSFGGDDLSQNHVTLITNEASDSKSIDSGVVQSDHSMHQIRQVIPAAGVPAPQHHPPTAFTPTPQTNLANPASPMHNSCSSSSSPPPSLPGQVPLPEMRAMNLNKDPKTSLQHMQSNHIERQPQWPGSSPRNSNTVPSLFQPTAPPLPPRHGQSVGNVDRRPSSGSSSTNNSMARRNMQSNPNSSRESLNITPAAALAQSQLSLISKPRPPSVHSTDRKSSITVGSRESLSLAPTETDRPAESPTFMSSPEDDSKAEDEIQHAGNDEEDLNFLTMPRNRSKSDRPTRTQRIISVFTRPQTTCSNYRPKCSKQNSLQKDSREHNHSTNSLSSALTAFNEKSNGESKSTSRLSVNMESENDHDDMSMSRTPSPRRPTSANSLLATIKEKSPLDPADEELENRRGSPTDRKTPSPIRNRLGNEPPGTLGSIQFNLTYLSEEKQLIIHLIRAKNLKAMDKNGFSDPYVKFHLIPGNVKATKLTSKTIEKTLNPEWNEEMIYYGITEDERLKKTLRVTVLDRDRIGSDFLGETRVALKKLPLGQTKKFNLYLEHAMPTPAEQSENTERGKILMSVCYNIQQACLFIHVKRCAELMGMDSSGFSDPYCKVSLTPLSSKQHRYKTAIKKRTLNPEFNEVIQFIVPFKDLPKKTLEIGVYDHDVGRHDDYIGGIVLSTAAKGDRGKQWTQCIENPGKTFEYWHKLETD
ncbi:unnamed protein product [Bursaphelenchus xylophilus]|uniref:(pine wood nematode) hypothetical protein n=1 Tax=Bursaphelenchus xylophilus TaxID=6326 RepID=A0A7I8WL63_BURXY|nr:unnamed protein product [Bursaphelenchus xylophilus]CAG9105816.1 unnamed protein product [Bursaphelenchus xylophilus]